MARVDAEYGYLLVAYPLCRVQKCAVAADTDGYGRIEVGAADYIVDHGGRGKPPAQIAVERFFDLDPHILAA